MVYELKAREIARKGNELFSLQYSSTLWSTAALATIIAGAALALVGAVFAIWPLISLGILGGVAGVALALFRWSYGASDEVKNSKTCA